MELNKNTRVTYLRDPKNRNRVMTVVSQRDEKGENLSFAFSINRPAEWKRSHETKRMHTERKEPGDTFNKRKGLEIALGRLEAKPTSVALNGRRPARAVLESLVSNPNEVVQRIVKAKLEYFDTLEAYREACDSEE